MTVRFEYNELKNSMLLDNSFTGGCFESAILNQRTMYGYTDEIGPLYTYSNALGGSSKLSKPKHHTIIFIKICTYNPKGIK